MAQNKTTENENSVTDFINSVEDQTRRDDCFRIAEIFKDVSGSEPKMWGHAIIGYGSYHYKYDSGREGDAPRTGFSPRKTEFALYIALFDGRDAMLAKLGKHKTGKGCVYIKKTADIDVDVLKKIIAAGLEYMRTAYPNS